MVGSPVGQALNASGIVDAPVEIPAWLAARRSRVESPANVSALPEASLTQSDPEIEFEEVAESESNLTRGTAATEPFKKGSSSPESLAVLPPPLPRIATPSVFGPGDVGPPLFNLSESNPKSKNSDRKGKLPIVENNPKPNDLTWKQSFDEWLRGPGMKGILVSLLVHAILVSALALIVIGGGKVNQALDIFGVVGDSDDRLLSAVELDSAVTILPVADSGGPEFTDVSQFINSESAMFDPHQSIRGGKGGTGHGVGDGDGDALLPPVNVPTYAVTKGSFSAWTEPRDPEPGRMYEIIIQFRLPPNVKSYRASDLTGMVTGTDLYKQVIRFQRNESFPVVDGAVRIKISVPGAARLVRDTIRIESKILREKQVLEIEF